MARAVLALEGDPAQLRSVFAGLRQDARSASNAVSADFKRLGDDAEKASQKMADAWARQRDRFIEAERAATAAVVDGVQHRKGVIDQEAGYRTNALRIPREDAARTEEAITTVVERGSRRRIAAYEREAAARRKAFERTGAEAAGRTFDAVAGATGQLVSEAGGVRRSLAERETSINNALVQLAPQGATAAEMTSTNRFIQDEIRRRNLAPDATIEAINRAQSFANALGGATPRARRDALMSTLGDVELASNIDPRNTAGLVNFGAMLRQRGVAEPVRQQMLRSAVGISFAGSVETADVLRGGLGGLLRSVSSATANAPASQRDQITRDVTADFLAQLQTVAQSGGTVTPTANRVNTLRTVLSNADTQNRLGQALAGRTMTDEQRALFSGAFRRGRDGKYTLGSEFVNSPSEAARLFGGLFGNDPTATANFLGVRGGGGNRQLLNRPEVGLLTSYFGMTQDSTGRDVRQYELVNELKRTTLTPAQEAQIAEVRRGELSAEERRREEERRRRVGPSTVWGRLSNAVDSFSAEHPFAAALGLGAVPALGRMAARAGGGRVGAALARFGSGAALRSAGLLGALLELGGSISGTDYNENQRRAAATAEYARTQGGAAPPRAADGTVPVRIDAASTQAIGQAMAQALRSSGGVPVQLPPNDESQARARGASGSPPPAP